MTNWTGSGNHRADRLANQLNWSEDFSFAVDLQGVPVILIPLFACFVEGFHPITKQVIQDNQKYSTMEIYVGNLPWSVTDQELADAFGAYGNVEKASIISDRDSGRSKGFGFVTMNDADEGNKAIEAMNGSEMGGRNLKVNEARPREDRPPRQDNW